MGIGHRGKYGSHLGKTQKTGAVAGKQGKQQSKTQTWGVSGSLTQLMHWPESSAHSRTQSSKPKVASRRAASAMQPPSTLSVWPGRGQAIGE